MKKILFSVIGAILGIPLSYYFQSDVVKVKVGGFSGYIQHLDEILKSKDLNGNVILSVLVFAIVGGVIGHYMDKNEKSKAD